MSDTEPDDLTPRQARFVEEYLVSLNATRAAICAGYSEKNSAGAGRETVIKCHGWRSHYRRTTRPRQAGPMSMPITFLANLVEVVERCMQRAPVMVRQGRELVQATE